jgi:NADP-dependent 3-hydroxy acid dehydrogenase YdfG
MPVSYMQARARKVNLRVSSISPGIVETEFYQASRAGDAEGAQKFYSQANYLQACWLHDASAHEPSENITYPDDQPGNRFSMA